MKHRIFRFAFALLVLSLLFNAPRAQQPTQSPEDRVALYQALLDLTNPWTVMCVAAHPDDEDGTSLIVMRHKHGAHTVSLFSTFGEGGQNAIGPELYEELGAIRARETMAAAEIQGSEPHFLGLKDFGYSKTRDEAFKFWGHEEALRRMVLEIRKLRPDVIITNHSTMSNDHGQHQATALMVVEAFDAAADPNKFPEQLKDGVTTWQVQRLFVRARGNQSQNADAQIVTIDPNEKDPVRGVVYAEEALRALQKHATQGPWPKTFAEYANRFRAFSGQSAPTGQLPMIRYALVRDARNKQPLQPSSNTNRHNMLDGVDSRDHSLPIDNGLPNDSHNFLDGLILPANFTSQLDVPLIDGKPLVAFVDDRAKVANALLQYAAKGYRLTSEKADFERLELMRDRINRATALAVGFVVQVEPSSLTVMPNSQLNLKIKVANNGNHTLNGIECGSELPTLKESVDLKKVSGPTSVFTTYSELKAGEGLTKNETVKIPARAAINTPLANHLYEATALGLPLVTHCSVNTFGLKGFTVTSDTSLNVAPPIEITSVSQSPFVITPQTEARAQALTVHVINHGETAAKTWVEVFGATENAGRTSETVADVTLDLSPGEQRDVVIKLPQLERRVRRSSVVTRVDLMTGVVQTTGAPRPSKPRFLIRTRDKSSNEVAVPLVYADARVPNGLRVGYIRGFDFSLPNALNALGVESKELSVDDVKTADLSKYTSVIVDNRVYESKPELIAVNQKLLDYANAGGNLIVFYHKSDEWNPDPRRNRPQLAPYKLILGNERITDEDAPITFIEPDHPLLNTPNKMAQDDFKDWIQERGLYYPREWDPQFHALLQSNDPGEAPLKGGLLVADYGRGHYIYTSMVWYRELRGGVPGAYRMLANMISYGQAEGKR
ncbi:MAG TPA: PIG-L family deacetylase [Pyrinomonadaceae bacterium]